MRNTDILYEQLAKKYYHVIYTYCYIKLNYNKEDAEDCTQNTFMVLYVSLPKMQNLKYIQAWLYKTANNFINRQKKINAIKNKKIICINDICNNDNWIYHDVDFINIIYDKKIDLSSCSQLILKQLNSDDLLLWEMYYKNHKNITEISRILKVSYNCTTTRIYRLKQKLMKILKHTMKQIEDLIYKI